MSRRPLLKIETSYPEGLEAGVHRLAGNLLGDQDGYGLLEKIKDDIEDGRRHVVLDLDGVAFANSSGMGILASIYNCAKAADGTLTLVRPNERLEQGLKIILLLDLVVRAASVEEALAALGKA